MKIIDYIVEIDNKKQKKEIEKDNLYLEKKIIEIISKRRKMNIYENKRADK